MKHLTEFKLFEYTQRDIDKDYRRIEDMDAKSTDYDHMIRLARQMANSITNAEKAYMRGRAAEDLNYHEVARIFFNRADELGYEG